MPLSVHWPNASSARWSNDSFALLTSRVLPPPFIKMPKTSLMILSCVDDQCPPLTRVPNPQMPSLQHLPKLLSERTSPKVV
ncbi:hypothetical protein RvY_17350 [Ramazzottius varieornatus]|uniref:Uncharacterized protein n=1 Tax=Ramazzottius varieornatus TaxID=947166 RepID=A0A1D1W1S9_RAMVA|nr:hypothetical protein RvY_17350 [Ramazzottius varieornatus]